MKKYFSTFVLLIIALPIFAKPVNEGKIAVNGGNIWYSIQGKEKSIPVLVIHGGPGGSSCALGELKELEKKRQVIFYDQLGAGKSDHPENMSLWEVHRFADELNTLITSLHLKKVHLLAHSWGAAVAGQYLQEKGTDHIASVIFAGPLLSANDWTADTNLLRKQLKPETQELLHKYEIAGTTASEEYQRASWDFYAKFLFHHPHADDGSCDENSWNPRIYEHMWGNSEFIVEGNLKKFDVTANLKNIHVPVLFLIGEFDEVTESTARKYQAQTPNAKLEIIKNAAHMSMVDEPQEFVKAVNSFLQNADKRK